MAELRKLELFHHLRENGSEEDDKRLIIYPVAYFKKEGLSLQRVFEMTNSHAHAWISAALWGSRGNHGYGPLDERWRHYHRPRDERLVARR